MLLACTLPGVRVHLQQQQQQQQQQSREQGLRAKRRMRSSIIIRIGTLQTQSHALERRSGSKP
jgi:hypothetical protein